MYDDLDGAWDVIHRALPGGWTAGRPVYLAERKRWAVWAIGPKPRGRFGAPPQVGGEGATEAQALIDLAGKLFAIR